MDAGSAILVAKMIPSGYVKSLLLNMAIEIVDFPMKNGEFP